MGMISEPVLGIDRSYISFVGHCKGKSNWLWQMLVSFKMTRVCESCTIATISKLEVLNEVQRSKVTQFVRLP